MNAYQNTIYEKHKELFDIADEVDNYTRTLLEKFNDRNLKLFDLPAHKRIFLFITTRSVKTFSAIHELCRRGYGQDVSTLLRSLLENLVTVKYILHDKKTADDKAARFVAYKWIILKRHLPEVEKTIKSASDSQKNSFDERRKLIAEKVAEFKKKFMLKSDRALLTWSGKTIKDMAKEVSNHLVVEYETTFRLCSRFSHPSILGDNEYLIQDDHNLIFSPLPSIIGVIPNLKNTLRYIIELLSVINDLFDFDENGKIAALEAQCTQIFALEKYQDELLENKPYKKSDSSIRESHIIFKTRQ